MFRSIVAAAALGALSAPALAATVAETSGSFTLGLTGEVPPGLRFTVEDPTLEADEATTGVLSEADAFADGFATPDPTGIDTGEVATTARADTTGGGTPGAAFADALVRIAIFAENTTDDLIFATGRLAYDISAFVAIDDPATDNASAGVLLELFIAGGLVFSDEVLADAASPGEVTSSGVIDLELPLPGGFGAPVVLTLTGTSLVDDVSPVPLPAGLPMLAAALGGLAVLRRRRAAA